MRLSPDETIFWQWEFVKVNATLVFTWVVMAVLVLGSWWLTSRLRPGSVRPRWQTALEWLVTGIEAQLKAVGLDQPRPYLGFLGTLFLFLAVSVLGTVFPYYEPPTSSLSTTTALALVVFFAVPFYGLRQKGLGPYLKGYLEPSPFLLPFTVIGEFSRTLALAVRLFGNMMSGAVIVAILVTITPLLFPLVMTVLGLFTGLVQAYIFSVLAAVYLAAATTVQNSPVSKESKWTVSP